MQKLMTLVLALWSLTTAGQTIMELKESGEGVNELYPDHWKLLDCKYGDLNKDGINDLAFVIQDTDTAKLEYNDWVGADTVDMNPRILGIYFGDAVGNYTRKLQSNDFILLRDSPTMDEPFDGLQITEKGILEVAFHLWFSAGSWSMSDHTYKFRYQDNQFALIGYDANEAHRGTGETSTYSINFLSRKMSITRGSLSGEQPESTEWRSFQLQNLKSIESLEKPFSWEFEGIYL